MEPKQIGMQIVAARKKLNLTQKELALQLNVSDKTISKWERGAGCPDISLLLPLCEQLHMEVSELLGKKEKEESVVIASVEENQKIHQFIEYAKLKASENKTKISKIIVIVLSILALLSIGICLIVEYALYLQFTWSLVASASILYGYFIISTLLLSDSHRIEKTMGVISVFLYPLLFVISWQPSLGAYFPIAYVIASGAIILMWIIYGVLLHLSINIYFRLSIIVLLSLLFNIFINVYASHTYSNVIILAISNIGVSIFLFLIGIIKQRNISLFRKKHI